MEQANINLSQQAQATVTTTSRRVKAAKKQAEKLQAELPTRLIFVLDKSSSMQAMQSTAISGFNEFLAAQQKLPGKAIFSLVYFSNDVIAVYENADIQKIPEMSTRNYVPDGMTAMNDGIGYTIDRYRDNGFEGKTIMAILTDGAENYSKRYRDPGLIKEMIKQVEDTYGWEVLFLGANIDSQQYAQERGIKLNKTADFAFTAQGVSGAMKSATLATSMYRGATATVGGMAMNASNVDMSTLYAAAVADDKLDVDPVQVDPDALKSAVDKVKKATSDKK